MKQLFLWGVAWGLATLFAQAQTRVPSATNGASSTSDSVQILYPADNSVVTQSLVRLIAIAKTEAAPASALHDGQSIKLESMSFAESWSVNGLKTTAVTTNRSGGNPSTWLKEKSGKHLLLTTLALKQGEQRVELGGAQLRIKRADVHGAEPPAGALFRSHPSVTDTHQPMACASCHEVQILGTRSLLGRAKLPGTCQTCHDAVDLRLTHAHVMEPLEYCLMFHDPHGSRWPSLLVATKDQVCTQCHEGGHTRH